MSSDQSSFHDFDPESTPESDRTITIVHVDESHDLYGGRGAYGRYLGETNPTKKGWLGNPHRVADHGREECIELFEETFIQVLRDDFRVANACVALPGRVVACHCRKRSEDEPACHLDVVREKLLDGTVFGIAKHAHDIPMADWKDELARSPEELI